jgi:hypothetical protein
LAAAGVYLSRRILRRSLSNDDTDAIAWDYAQSGVVFVWMDRWCRGSGRRGNAVRLQLRQRFQWRPPNGEWRGRLEIFADRRLTRGTGGVGRWCSNRESEMYASRRSEMSECLVELAMRCGRNLGDFVVWGLSFPKDLARDLEMCNYTLSGPPFQGQPRCWRVGSGLAPATFSRGRRVSH